ncbi:hypothetical protein HN51_063442, partial [Arachis hypogaea]
TSVSISELKENHPEFGLVLDTSGDKLPNTFNLAYKSVPVHDVTVGSYIFVGAGEIIDIGKILPLFMELQTLGDKT